MQLIPVGKVRSHWSRIGEAPKQGRETDVPSALEVFETFEAALEGLANMQTLVVLTWFDRADREILRVHPRGDRSEPLRGVFSTRSPHRPNPIGLHVVDVLRISGNRIEVRGMDALDGTPILDIKPWLKNLDAPEAKASASPPDR
ncbi:MAG: tRNA (N6-threonylcarbamoyladenosine(37)-N6)-methyltransferase TrmO [Deltaproteobacteria bacterium]|nr:tRNA (N6-threonylcarbamoyladenosine(37)-N6)-methyltransferase TrmO [Deltaproteobacteria bacterium]